MHAQEGRAIRSVEPEILTPGYRRMRRWQSLQALHGNPRQVDEGLAITVRIVLPVSFGPGGPPGGVVAEPERVEDRRIRRGAVAKYVVAIIHRVRVALHGAKPEPREDDAQIIGRTPREISLLRQDVVERGDISTRRWNDRRLRDRPCGDFWREPRTAPVPPLPALPAARQAPRDNLQYPPVIKAEDLQRPARHAGVLGTLPSEAGVLARRVLIGGTSSATQRRRRRGPHWGFPLRSKGAALGCVAGVLLGRRVSE